MCGVSPKAVASVVNTTHEDLVEGGKLQRAVHVNGRPDVLHVVAVLHLVQLLDTRHVRETRLDLGQIRHLQPKQTRSDARASSLACAKEL